MTVIAGVTGQLAPALLGKAPTPAADQSFGAIFDSLVNTVAAPLRNAETAAIAGIEGKLPVQSVVEAVMQAERGLQTAIAVRDMVVGAYLEISRMQI
jgi:flagellar hook-basal body complex protein FliE